MENTLLIQLTNQKAAGLLHELEELHLIKVIKETVSEKQESSVDKTEKNMKEELPKKKVSFTVLHVDTKNYKFNRDEANER